ncbi:MAG: hypothetical protein M3O55_07025 [Actinomycetota bacterium]|nr:hypothetical protein [Actinomycetota bacterium]
MLDLVDVIGSAPEAHDGTVGEEPPPGLWRRRLRLAATLSVVAVVVAWAGAAHRAGHDSAPRPAPDLAVTIGAILGEPRADQPVDQVVIDSSGWYALLAVCAGPGACRETLTVSGDAGMSWRRYPLPGAPQPHDGQLSMLAPSTLLLINSHGRWITHDGGRHWQRAAAVARGAVAESVPAGGRATLGCVPTVRPGGCDAFRVAVTDPATGADAPLRHQPALRHPLIAAAPAGDGSLWVSGTDRAGRAAVAVSTDRGRSWITSTLPFTIDNVLHMTLLTRGGPLAYALVTAVELHAPRLIGLNGIARTDDGGRTWRIVRADDRSRPATARAAALLADGVLVVSVEPPDVGVFTSRDGGQSFGPMAEAPAGLSWFGDAGTWLLATGGGYLWRLDPDGRWHLLRPEIQAGRPPS